jgi:catechol 2,3-dioxygenase-like lactoylglutathione lyase family enzyme
MSDLPCGLFTNPGAYSRTPGGLIHDGTFHVPESMFMTILRIEHVQLAIPVGGEALARAFYTGVLGIPEIPKPPHLAKRGGCWFERDELKIHLGVEADFRPARKAHPALLVADLEALSAKLRSSGYAPREDEPLEGYRRVYVDDPFGNRLELMEPHAHAAAAQSLR